jgi:hypothetical protein
MHDTPRLNGFDNGTGCGKACSVIMKFQLMEKILDIKN